MPINNNYLIVLDLETSGKDAEVVHAFEVAAKVYHPIHLEPVENGEFHSYMKIPADVPVEQGAMRVTKKTEEEVRNYPLEPKVVWNNFADWVQKYYREKSKWGAPLACGYNIRNFDCKIIDRMLKLYHPKKDLVLFSDFRRIDLMEILFYWFDFDQDLKNMQFDTVREYFGLAKEGAHGALQDVRQEGLLLMKFLKLFRSLKAVPGKVEGEPWIKFKGSCANVSI